MQGLTRFIEGRLRLKVNVDKSMVAPTSEIHFLGFSLKLGEESQVEVHLSKRSTERMDIRIRELTPRTWGQSIEDCIKQANRYLTGWAGYFVRLCTEESVRLLQRFDAHIRRRIRAIIVKQKKRPRYLYRHLISRGVSPKAAKLTAYSRRGPWKKSILSGLHVAYRNAWFHQRLVSLDKTWGQLHPPATVSGQAFLPGIEIPS
jgi:RNA-directed DNA polymerase